MAKIGEKLNQELSVGAGQSFFDKHGLWYHAFERFPGALFDCRGYVTFQTRADYDNSPFVKVNYDTNSVHIKAPGISAIPGYVHADHSEAGRVS